MYIIPFYLRGTDAFGNTQTEIVNPPLSAEPEGTFCAAPTDRDRGVEPFDDEHVEFYH